MTPPVAVDGVSRGLRLRPGRRRHARALALDRGHRRRRDAAGHGPWQSAARPDADRHGDPAARRLRPARTTGRSRGSSHQQRGAVDRAAASGRPAARHLAGARPGADGRRPGDDRAAPPVRERGDRRDVEPVDPPRGVRRPAMRAGRARPLPGRGAARAGRRTRAARRSPAHARPRGAALGRRQPHQHRADAHRGLRPRRGADRHRAGPRGTRGDGLGGVEGVGRRASPKRRHALRTEVEQVADETARRIASATCGAG